MSDLAPVLHRLHGLDPSEFVAARNAAAAELTGADARKVKALRRPTVAAWVVNRLVREHPEQVEALADLGDQLRDAQEAGDGAAMRELDKERRTLTSRALAEADVVVGGIAASAREGVESTLRAVVLDADAATAVLAGNLSGALSASAFATVSTGTGTGARRPAARPRRGAGSAKDRDAERESRLAEARRHLERVRAELAEADGEADEAEEARDAAADAADEAAGRLERARAALAEAEQEHEDSGRALTAADRELDAAREQADAAALAVASAERDVAALEKPAP